WSWSREVDFVLRTEAFKHFILHLPPLLPRVSSLFLSYSFCQSLIVSLFQFNSHLVFTLSHTHTHTHTHGSASNNTHTHTRTHTHTHSHTQTNTHTHKHLHAHKIQRSEEHTSALQSQLNLVCTLL